MMKVVERVLKFVLDLGDMGKRILLFSNVEGVFTPEL